MFKWVKFPHTTRFAWWVIISFIMIMTASIFEAVFPHQHAHNQIGASGLLSIGWGAFTICYALASIHWREF